VRHAPAASLRAGVDDTLRICDAGSGESRAPSIGLETQRLTAEEFRDYQRGAEPQNGSSTRSPGREYRSMTCSATASGKRKNEAPG
jgi:hypothetical protein